MRLMALPLVALVLLATPAAAENPDGPRGLLTVDGAFAPIVADGVEVTGSQIADPRDVGGSDLRVTVLAPVTKWLTLGAETRRWAFSQDYEAGYSSDYWEVYVGVRARVHLALTEHAKRSLAAEIGARGMY